MLPVYLSIYIAMTAGSQLGAPADVPPTHWAHKAVDDLYKEGILRGYPGGANHGDRPVTREEMAAALSGVETTVKRVTGSDPLLDAIIAQIEPQLIAAFSKKR